jgi:hypothetical protein
MKYLQHTRDILVHIFPRTIKYEIPLYFPQEIFAFQNLKFSSVDFKFVKESNLLVISVTSEPNHDVKHSKAEVASGHSLL